MNLATILFGSLAGPECQRALARGWLIVVRTLIGLLLAAIVVFMIYIWWFAQVNDPYFNPAEMLRFSLSASAMILLTISLVQAPRFSRVRSLANESAACFSFCSPRL